MISASVLVAGCATQALDQAPPSADQPWHDPQLSASRPAPSTKPGQPAVVDFSIAQAPLTNPQHWNINLDPKKRYTLAELIDIAQSNNPSTRAAWNRAREAALATGMVEATFLPMISANAIGGYQQTNIPSQLIIGPSQFTTDLSGTVAALTFGWLVFDFGQRIALLESAKQLSRAANILFNAEHQKVIWQVTTRYYNYVLAKRQLELANQALKYRQSIASAAKAKQKAGLGTVVETALAEQWLKQAELHKVNMQGLLKNAYLNLLASAGIAPTTNISIAVPDEQIATQHLRNNLNLSTQALEASVSSRPDVAASYAALQAARANIDAVKADFFPKVYLAGALASSNTTFDLQGLPSLSQQMNSSGILFGVTLPLYDGGLRNARLVSAQIRTEQAEQNYEQLQRDAIREIVLAQTMLESALQSAETARSLVKTAKIAYDAALGAYREGLGTITMVNEAADSLLTARQALAESETASIVSAANLAMAMGRMTSANAATGLATGNKTIPAAQ